VRQPAASELEVGFSCILDANLIEHCKVGVKNLGTYNTGGSPSNILMRGNKIPQNPKRLSFT
jgi:hypothetical protein